MKSRRPCAGILRRHPHNVAAASVAVADGAFLDWSLDRVDWRLIAPNGRSCRLSSNEITFFQILAASPGEPVSRDAITQAITRHQPAENASTVNSRNLDAVVRRLRRKVSEATGQEAPVRMVYGVGYVLTATMRQIGE